MIATEIKANWSKTKKKNVVSSIPYYFLKIKVLLCRWMLN
jgi:hypothetical protein